MKRGAERQLTKDGPDDEDIEEIHDPQDFQKADESTLARRPIRALPKRALATSRPPSLNGLPPVPNPAPVIEQVEVEAVPQQKFGGFVGFGAGTSASNPFTFSAQPPAVFAPSPSAFDTTVRSAPSAPASVSPFLGAPRRVPSDPVSSPPKPATSPPAEEIDTIAFKYFKSLRGLNVSFISAISTAVEKDPFFDVANLVESYKNLRTTIQSEFDDSSQPSTVRGVTANFAPLFGARAPPAKTTSLFSMPKPPVGFADASPKLPSTSESGTKIGGFTFPPLVPPSSSAPTQSPFGLTPKPSESSGTSSATLPEPPKSAFAFAASNTLAATSNPPPTSGISFVAPLSIENTTSNSVLGFSSQETEGSSAGSSRPTSTAPSLGSGGVPNFFATAKPTSPFGTYDAAPKPTSVFGSSMFGNSSTESSKSSPFNPSPPDPDSKDSKVTTTLFGNATATSSSTSASIFQSSSNKPVSFFGSASPPRTGAFAFGKPAGSIGNPVGFGFGSSSPSAGDTILPGSGFSFGAPSMKPSESLFSPPMTDRSSESTPQPDGEGNEEGGEETAKLLPSHTHDEEGEGEEDEETTHVVKCKVYRLFKSEDKSEWKDLGVGMFRLKKHKETNVRRVLMRNSNTGRILVNFRIHGSLKPSLTKTAVSFVGYENSTPVSFSVRTKTEEQARDLKQALEQEIATAQAAE